MATKNAIDSNIPIEASKGGTGAATLTDHGVLVGSGTAAIDALAVGGTGTLLVGVTGADPAFANSANSDFTFTSSTAGALRNLGVTNTDNTNAASTALVSMTTGGSSAGDSMVNFKITGATDWTVGCDNSDDDALVMSASASLGTTNVIRIKRTGEITMPLQSAFSAYLGTADNNVTGNGATYTLGSGNALTEIFDQNADFNTNGTFTAPVTGKYFLSATVRSSGITNAMTSGEIMLVTTARTYYSSYVNPYAAGYVGGVYYTFTVSTLADMTAGDTATVQLIISGGAGDTADIDAGNRTFFTGYLVC